MSERRMTLVVSEARARELERLMLDGDEIELDQVQWWVESVKRNEAGEWQVAFIEVTSDEQPEDQ